MNPIKKLPPIIKTERLELRQLEPTPENAQMIFDAVRNENPDDFHFEPISHKNNIPQSAKEILDKMKLDVQWNDENGVVYYIFHNNNLIGYRRMNYFESNETFQFGVVWFIKSERGRGFAKETMLEFEKVAFETLGANRIIRQCNPTNVASINLAKSLGYHLDGVIRQSIRDINGEFFDLMVFTKLKSEYK